MNYDFVGWLGFGLIVAGAIVRFLGRSQGGTSKEAGDRLGLIVGLAGVVVLSISLFLARR